ncbi:MAG: hypothetical protein KGD73_01580 [Candidatus Lokiarchaeota archaeon]|nr:hypothetical protein [Candidatus Lokiarchaeota archaeon]
MITELIDLYERDFTSDVSALTNIGKRISGNKDIMIQFRNNIQGVYTDSKFIYLPEKFKKHIKPTQGLVAHESGHIGYGSFELAFIKLITNLAKKYELPPLFIKYLINVVEDVRINGINNIKFPGFYRNLRDLTYKMLPQIKSSIKSNNDILLYINLFMEDFGEFQKKPSLGMFSLSEKDWKGIAKVKKFLLRSLNPSASLISCDVLCNILKKYFPKKDSSTMQKGGDSNPYMNSNPRMSPNPSMNPSPHMNTINHIEINSQNKKPKEKSELDKISEKLIDKLKDINLGPEDLDDLEDPDDILNPDGKFSSKDKEKNQNKKKKGNTDETIDEDWTKSENSKDINKVDKENKKKGKNFLNEELDSLFKIAFDLEDLKKDLVPRTQNPLTLDNSIKERKNDFISLKDERIKDEYMKEISALVKKADSAMKERLLILGGEKYHIYQNKGERERKVIDVKIETQKMCPDAMTYIQIKTKYHNIIKKMNLIFADLKNKASVDNFQKKGRLNNKFIKAITSDYQFNQCFTRKINNKELRLLLIVDISGSMKGVKIRAAKIAMVMLYEALEDLGNIRIVLFTGGYDALNILVKDFNEPLKLRYFDKFGCHTTSRQNLDGISIKHESQKLEKKDIIIVVSDGQPAADGGYSLVDAIPDIHDVRKRFKIFAFSIDSQGDYLNKMYGKDWILTSTRNELELGNKMLKFCQIIVKEFYRY